MLVLTACGEATTEGLLASGPLSKPIRTGGMVIRHPQDGATVKARGFTFNAQLPSPIGQAIVVTLTIRDQVTGDELSTKSIVVNGPAANQSVSQIVVRHPKDGGSVNGDTFSHIAHIKDLPPGRAVTLATTVRDRETGDELAAFVITVNPR